MQASRIGEVVDQRIERAGKSHEEAGQCEGDPDMPFNGDAEEAGAALVLADRDHGAAEWRAQNKSHGADHHGKAKQHEKIEVVGTGENVELEQAEVDRLTREAAQAVVAARQRTPLKCDVVEYLAESDRHHGEIDATPPHDERAENGAANAAQQHSRDKRERRARRQELQRQPGAVGAKTEIGGMAERQNAGKSQQEIQRHRRQSKHKDTGGERGIAAERRHPIGREQQGCPDRREDDQLAGLLGAQLIIPSSPNNPRGRRRRTTAIMT